MKSSVLSLLVSFSMVAFLTACSSDSDGDSAVQGSSIFDRLTVEEVHSASVNDAVSDTNTSYYMFTASATGEHNISATILSLIAFFIFYSKLDWFITIRINSAKKQLGIWSIAHLLAILTHLYSTDNTCRLNKSGENRGKNLYDGWRKTSRVWTEKTQ